jgi:hypothetical protein
MAPNGYAVHRTRQRLRLRVPDKRGDSQWFVEAAEVLERLAGVDRVEAAPLSASLILYCDTTDGLDERLGHAGVLAFQKRAPAKPTAAQRTQGGVSWFERALYDSSQGRVDLRSLVFLLMLGLAGVQVIRGQVLVPAISLFWYAMEMALGARAQSRQEVEGDR